MPALPVGIRLGQQVAAECAAIDRALSGRTVVHTRVHEARKAIRRLRAMLALVERRLDVDACDARLQKLGDGLGPLRDAYAAWDAASRLAAKHGRRRWAPVTRALRARADQVASRTLERDPHFARRRQLIQRVAARLQQLDWDRLGPHDLRDGLRRQCKRTDKAATRAKHDPDPEHLHRWRRKARRLRMQFEALAPLKLGALSARSHPARRLHKLSDRLGWHQDLVVLTALVRRLPGIAERQDLLARLEVLSTQMQQQLGDGR